MKKQKRTFKGEAKLITKGIGAELFRIGCGVVREAFRPKRRKPYHPKRRKR